MKSSIADNLLSRYVPKVVMVVERMTFCPALLLLSKTTRVAAANQEESIEIKSSEESCWFAMDSVGVAKLRPGPLRLSTKTNERPRKIFPRDSQSNQCMWIVSKKENERPSSGCETWTHG